MKRFKLTYLLVLLCTLVASCMSEDVVESYPGTGLGSEEDEVKILLSASNNAIPSVDDKTEQYIKDIEICLFDNATQKFLEKAEVSITGEDGDAKRNIYAILRNNYKSYASRKLDLLIFANLGARGIALPSLGNNSTPQDLYGKLTFSYDKNWWSIGANVHNYIPMFGKCTLNGIIYNEVNQVKEVVVLQRAVARIDVLLNDGKGLNNFSLKTVQVYRYNNKGYCAPKDGNPDATDVYIPSGSYNSNSISYIADNNEKISGLVQRIYVPEYKNKNATYTSYLKVTGILKKENGTEETKSYDISFKDQNSGTDFDLVRNNLYRFNITRVGNTSITTGLEYIVEKWGDPIEIDVPSFD